MAMNNPAQTYGTLSEVVDEAARDETPVKKKANTVTTGIGAFITAVIAGLTYLAESGTELPGWTPFAVTVVGMVATVLGVNFTKNGITESTKDKLNAALAKKIDEAHELGHAEPAPADSWRDRVDDVMEDAGEAAARFEDAAQRIAKRLG